MNHSRIFHYGAVKIYFLKAFVNKNTDENDEINFLVRIQGQVRKGLVKIIIIQLHIFKTQKSGCGIYLLD